ncbi:DBP2 [Symbiodinium sp. CCMP2592]|nr:DBP2 [Symbiodinium sp. CCMP2592]
MAVSMDATAETTEAEEMKALEMPAQRILPQRVLDGDWLSHELPKLHKDFYLNHPDPALHCEQFCWGNLEEAHPVLGRRTQDEAAEYRKSRGIVVTSVRGRPAPKPFQTFQETSFPSFVEELAMELFSSEALPFSVQAQAWPCALAGADVIAVAPTGSGKTLAFLLPALVHIMAQPVLTVGEGPIALFLEPTRELAVQTHGVAQQFCNRTKGEDLLRAGVIYGGQAAELQTPLEGAPDFGRWPEILVATPGRLWELMTKKCWISAKRMSYVVLDEADHMLATGTWLCQIQELLRLLRKDRQLLLFSATLPLEAERAALEICGDELFKIQVDPKIPSISQDVKLFPGAYDGGYEAKTAELQRWIREDLKDEESLLILCHKSQIGYVASDSKLRDAVASVSPDGMRATAVLDHQQRHESQQSPYKDFVRKETRALISTFSLAGRGLDFHDTGSYLQLSLAVVLFDFPANIGEYANCIGRTSRPGQKEGRVYAFLPEGRFWIAGELIQLLEHCGQQVPQDLQDLSSQDAAFMAEVKAAMQQLLAGELSPESLPQGQGTYDPASQVWTLPASIPSYRRKLIHTLADELSLPHVSYGASRDRKLCMATDRKALPEKYFVEGEAVIVVGRNGHKDRGRVKDPRLRFRNITVCFDNTKFFGEYPLDVRADDVWPEGEEPSGRDRQDRQGYLGRRTYAAYQRYR